MKQFVILCSLLLFPLSVLATAIAVDNSLKLLGLHATLARVADKVEFRIAALNSSHGQQVSLVVLE